MTQASVQEAQTVRAVVAAWALLAVRLLARGYLVFLLALAASATVPMVFGLTGTVVQSGSMMPYIDVGDAVLSFPLPPGADTPMGHVVTFPVPAGSAETGIRLHRIVGTNPDGSLITAGDANREVDSDPLARADIIAVACLLIPWIGLPAFWLQHGSALPFLGWLAVTLLALVIEFRASRAETTERRDAGSRHAAPPRRGIPALVHGIGVESVLPVVALVLCAAMVAIAPITPSASSAFTGHSNNAGNQWTAATDLVASKLVFTTNPSNATGGAAFGTQPTIAIRTSTGGSTVSTAPVTLALTTPAGATLNCSANPKDADAGSAQFAGCKVDTAGSYTLTATSPGLAAATSASFTISVGPSYRLVFTTTPLNTARNTAFTKQPVVTVKDAGGNTVTTSAAAVSLALTVPAGASLTNCAANPRTAVAGVATFSGCRINTVGSYTLTATSGTLQSAVSAPISIFNTASKLVFVVSPGSTASGVDFAAQPVVAIQDSTGNTTSGTSSITLAITTPAGATLSCTTNPRSAVNGTATFTGCDIGKAGTYTLRATASGLTAATSATFTITAGPASRLSFTSSPSSSTSSTVFSSQPVVAVFDTFGNSVASTASVSLTITTPAAATLTCTSNPKAAVAGVASFAGCRVDKAGSYTLTATASGLATALSSNFAISAGSASQVVITRSPGASVRNIAFPTQPIVQIQDDAGNPVSTTTLVSLSITSPTGGANLSCSINPVLLIGTTATFSGCRIDRAGTYTLTASAFLLASGESATFVVG
ncbi:MAG: S26 family signal peptidase [Pseudolysinimonas sp.]